MSGGTIFLGYRSTHKRAKLLAYTKNLGKKGM
jgi:hypothetical protein